MCFDRKENNKLQVCVSIIQYFYNGGKIRGMFLFRNETPNESDILTERQKKNKCNYNTSLK